MASEGARIIAQRAYPLSIMGTDVTSDALRRAARHASSEIVKSPLQLADEKAGRPPDSQIKIAGVAVVAGVGDDTDVWPGGVHVELLK